VRALLRVAATRRRVSRAVVAFAIAYNTVAIVLCLAGKMSPLLAAVLMPASSLVTLAIVFAGFGGAIQGFPWGGRFPRAATLASGRQAMA
jgi:hypothetical protein